MVAPSLKPKLVETLDLLRADGIKPTDAEIVWLASLREACDTPTADDWFLPGAPLQIAGESWYPLHMLAEDWFWRAYQLIGDRGSWQTWCYLYAHIKSAPGDKSLLYCTTREHILRDVGSWRRGCALHEANEGDLVALLRRMDGYGETVSVDTEHAGNERKASVSSGVMALCKTFSGTTPEYWRTGISVRETDLLARAGKSESWERGADRARAIANYLTAVKIIRREHGKPR